MNNKNYDLLKLLILDEIFSKISTSEASQRLGFKNDTCKRWLQNKKILRWDEFVLLCTELGVDLKVALNIFPFGCENLDSAHFFSQLKMFCAFETNQELADYLNCHVSVIKRYQRSDTVPDLEAFLRLIDYTPNFLGAFISGLFPNGVKNSFLKQWIEATTKTAQERSNFTRTMIETCLLLDQYKDRTIPTDEWLSSELGIPLKEIQETLKIMLEAGNLSIEGEDIYKSVTGSVFVAGSSFASYIPFYQAANQRFINYLEKKKNDENPTSRPGIVGVQIYPANKEIMEKANLIIIKANSEIFKLLEESGKNGNFTEVCCLLTQIYTLTSKN